MQETEVKTQNKMGYMPCGKLVLSMSLPMMLSMLFQALYNIVDSVFVARINESALTAVSLAFPIQTLIIALVGGTGVGVNARLSAKLGEHKLEEVNYTAGNAITISFIYSIVMILIAKLTSGVYFDMMTPDVQIREYGISYVFIVLCLSPALTFQMLFERLLQSTGKTVYSMISQIVGAVINIIMDPILIFGLCGLPAMGTKGAALATVFGQTVACFIGLFCNLKYNNEIKFGKKYFRLHKQTVANIFAVGIPSIVMQSIASVMNFGMNRILLSFSSTAAAVFGVYFKLQSFIFLPVFGLNNGLVPIIAYNFGARRPDRIKDTLKHGVIYAVAIMLFGVVAFELLPVQLLSIFDASENMLAIGTPALRIIAIHFVLAGFSIVCMSSFQALGHGVLSMWVSLIRQLVVLLPCAYILSGVIGLNGAWTAFPIAEVVALTISVIFMKKYVKPQLDSLALSK
ncbi:MAG: MATE family efflux transporter [Eubacteriales bacterium]|nr:MATE family efflux transporter [Eubacteriales bacterium]